MPKEARMTNDLMKASPNGNATSHCEPNILTKGTDNHSSLGIRHSFVVRHSSFVISLSLLFFLYVGCAKGATPTKAMVAMSDGIRLATDVFVPEKGGPKFSTILVRTPYNKDALKQAAAN